MNRKIASLAVILCLVVQASIEAQERRGSDPVRRTQPVRSSHAAHDASGRPLTNSGAERRSAPRQASASRPIVSRPLVQQASHEHVVPGEVIYEDAGIMHGGCDSCGGSGCSSCDIGGGSFCNSCSAPNQFCICLPAHGWVNPEYLLWFPSGMRTPALVTTSPAGTARDNAGVLGIPGTGTLLGNDDLLDDERSGFRIRFGWWLAAFPKWGIEGEYVGLGEETESFFRQSDGAPILARPFLNVTEGREDSELIAFPGVVGGSIAVDATSTLDGAAIRLRRQMCCSTGCGYSELCCQTVPTASRLDATLGYRFWELSESLVMRERLQSQLANEPGSFDITDRFDTRNQFNGTELGVLWQGRRGWWSLDALMRVAVGNVKQTVTIDGTTTIVENGLTTNSSGGFLAQRTNSGTFDRDTFTMVPEFGATVGYQVTKRLRATVGYSLIYWGNVVRPGDQVDLDVNPNLLPPENVPFSGPLRPQFSFVETDYYVHGLNFGGEFRW